MFFIKAVALKITFKFACPSAGNEELYIDKTQTQMYLMNRNS